MKINVTRIWIAKITLAFFMITNLGTGTLRANEPIPGSGDPSLTPTTQPGGETDEQNPSETDGIGDSLGESSALSSATAPTREDKAEEILGKINKVKDKANEIIVKLQDLADKHPYVPAISVVQQGFKEALENPNHNLKNLTTEADRLKSIITSSVSETEKDKALTDLQRIEPAFADNSALVFQINYYESEEDYLKNYSIPMFETKRNEVIQYQSTIQESYAVFQTKAGKLLTDYETFKNKSRDTGVAYIFGNVAGDSLLEIKANVDRQVAAFTADADKALNTASLGELRHYASTAQAIGQILTGDSPNSFTGVITYYEEELAYYQALYDRNLPAYTEFNTVIDSANAQINSALAKIETLQTQAQTLRAKALSFGDASAEYIKGIDAEVLAPLTALNTMVDSIKKFVSNINDFIKKPTSTSMINGTYINQFNDSIKEQIEVLDPDVSTNLLSPLPEIEQEMTRYKSILAAADSVTQSIKKLQAIQRAIALQTRAVNPNVKKIASAKTALQNLSAISLKITNDIKIAMTTILNPKTTDQLRTKIATDLKSPAKVNTLNKQVKNIGVHLENLNKFYGRRLGLGRRR